MRKNNEDPDSTTKVVKLISSDWCNYDYIITSIQNKNMQPNFTVTVN